MDEEKPMQLHVVIGVMVIKNGKFLMIERPGSDGASSWSIPSNVLEFGETPEVAAAKAAMEKVALVVGNYRFGALTNDIHEFEGQQFVTIWMLADWQGGEPVKRDESITNLAWHSFDDLPSPLSQPWTTLLNSEFINTLRAQLQTEQE